MRAPPSLPHLIVLAALPTLTLNMFLPSLPAIAAEFGVSYRIAGLSIGLYLALTAVLQLLIGPISDLVGRRPVLLGSLGIFTLASLGCALAPSFDVFLILRLMQGPAVAGYALSMAMVRDTRGGTAAVGVIGTINAIMAVAPMVGPVIGGGLDAVLGWRAIFAVYAVAGAGLWAVTWHRLAETRPARATAQKLRPTALLRLPLFWGYALCGAFSVSAFYIFITGTPLVAAAVFDVGAGTIGVLVGSITAGFILGSLVTRRLSGRVETLSLILTGRVVATGGLSLALLAAVLGPVSGVITFAGTMCVGIGNGLTMPGCSAGAMSVRPDLAGSAAGLFGAMTVGMGAIATTLASAVLDISPTVPALLALMVCVTCGSLLAALYVWRAQSR